MLAEERFREILKIVNEKKTVTVTELTELLDTSESTIRRDLTQLHKRGALLKVHGGATVLNGAYTTKDAKVSEREGLYVEEKRSIAKLAAALIGQEDFVYIDAGTSTASLAEAISEREAVYVTNGIHLEKGYTTPDISEALVKEAAMKRCREAYVLADSSKFGHVSSVTFARFEDAQIITDHISDPVFQTCSNIEEAES